MSRYRILYFCMLSMAVSYYVMDTRYLSWLLLVMILLLVPLEVLLSLPGLLTLRIKLTAEPLSPTQGGLLPGAGWKDGRAALPVGALWHRVLPGDKRAYG